MTTKQISAHRTIGPEPGTWRAPYRMKENASEGGSGPCGESQRHAGAVLGGKQWAGCWVVGRGGKGRGGRGAEVVGRAGSRKVEMGPLGGSSSSTGDERKGGPRQGRGSGLRGLETPEHNSAGSCRGSKHCPTQWPISVGGPPPSGKNRLGSKGGNAFIEGGLGAWEGGNSRRPGALQVPNCRFRFKGLRQRRARGRVRVPRAGWRLSEGDAVLIQREQQQDGPAA